MSFTCYFCGCPQDTGVKPQKVPLEKRLVLTGVIQEEEKEREEDPRTHLRIVLRTVYSKYREEIVKEVSACPACAAQHHFAKIVDIRDESKPVLSRAKT